MVRRFDLFTCGVYVCKYVLDQVSQLKVKCQKNVTALQKALNAERWYLKFQPKDS